MTHKHVAKNIILNDIHVHVSWNEEGMEEDRTNMLIHVYVYLTMTSTISTVNGLSTYTPLTNVLT